MKPRDKINKSTWTLHSNVKDTVERNISNACRSGQLKIEAKQLPTLLALISSSADEGYHRAQSSFMRTFDEAAAEIEKDTLLEAEFALAKKN